MGRNKLGELGNRIECHSFPLEKRPVSLFIFGLETFKNVGTQRSHKASLQKEIWATQLSTTIITLSKKLGQLGEDKICAVKWRPVFHWYNKVLPQCHVSRRDTRPHFLLPANQNFQHSLAWPPPAFPPRRIIYSLTSDHPWNPLFHNLEWILAQVFKNKNPAENNVPLSW